MREREGGARGKREKRGKVVGKGFSLRVADGFMRTFIRVFCLLKAQIVKSVQLARVIFEIPPRGYIVHPLRVQPIESHFRNLYLAPSSA